MKQTARVGDVFTVPIDSTRLGIGQIVADWQGELYIVIFDAVYPAGSVDPQSAISERPLFAALSLDAKIHNGDWLMIGNVSSNLGSFAQPVFKVNHGGRIFLESRDRSIFRPASHAEAEVLRFRTVVAPVRLEKALKANFGQGDWSVRFDELRYEYPVVSSRLISRPVVANPDRECPSGVSFPQREGPVSACEFNRSTRTCKQAALEKSERPSAKSQNVPEKSE